MGYKCTFMDNGIYSAEDVNAMFANLTSEGVVLNNSGNVLADLNEANSEIVTEGVQNFADSCRLSCKDGVYKIGEGVCFMPDGSAITFDEEGYEVVPERGVKNYVYFERDVPQNTINVVVSTEPGSDGTVAIGEINESGVVRDRRVYAKAKVRLVGEKTLKALSHTFEAFGADNAKIDIGTGNFSRIIVGETKIYLDGVLNSVLTPLDCDTLHLEDGVLQSCDMKGQNGVRAMAIDITKEGQYLILRLGNYHQYAEYIQEFEII